MIGIIGEANIDRLVNATIISLLPYLRRWRLENSVLLYSYDIPKEQCHSKIRWLPYFHTEFNKTFIVNTDDFHKRLV